MTSTPPEQPYGPQGGWTSPPPPPPSAPGGYHQPPMSDADQRLWAMLAHLGGLIAAILAPLVIWLVLRERGAYVEDQAKEALNFQITLMLASIAFMIIGIITLGVGFILFLAFIVALIWMIQAAIATNRGEPYRYPLNIRLVR